MPYTKDYISLLSSELISFISFISNPEKKAIFVDCDNTLWNGILGEDGLNGIYCDRNAKGVLFFQFQEFLLEKKKEGFILGICSKNNEQDVKEAFEKLKMPLKWNDFLVKKVNWLNKSDNLKEAAKDLNIGLDSIIFIDDNDFEIQLVNSMLPEVYTRKLVNDYNAFLLLSEDYAFKRKRLTKEDIEKNELYFAEQQRINIKASVQSFEEYLESLAIKLDITVNNESDLGRLSQLTEKTNQFNFNKEPYSVSGLKNFLSANNLVYGIRVSDKFGDYGLVGLILIKVLDKQAILQNFLLSCRALGRLIEDNFFSYVLNDLEKKGIKLHEIVFKESPKNAPAKSFFDKLKKVQETFQPINIK
jgi:FkbH-like protein